MEPSRLIDELIAYAYKNLDLNQLDEMYVRNNLLSIFGLDTYVEGDASSIIKEVNKMEVPDEIIVDLHEFFTKKLGLNDIEAELKEGKAMDAITPMPSYVNEKFNCLLKKNDFKALQYLYDLSVKNNYVAKTRIEKNLVWTTNIDKKDLEISINLSKPEKNTKDIAKLLEKKSASDIKYPKCLLCYENLGYYGRLNHPARSNIRVIDLKLEKEDWFLQFSPYGYFDMHCIVVDKCHRNMIIDRGTFVKFFDFIDMFPSFFIGSNADLPIVGGSILDHEHYQGGRHVLPAMNAKIKSSFHSEKFKETEICILDWFNSTILLKGKNKKEIIELADLFLRKWRNYDDVQNNIISHEGNVMHNTVTPGLKIDKHGDYCLYLILRNNRCDTQNEDGIFHAHKEFYHIKKENIGIIEAMGRFILPARLIRQSNEIKDALSQNLSNEKAIEKYPDLNGFEKMIEDLRLNFDENTFETGCRAYINNVCKNILINTAVFKNDKIGVDGFEKFIKGTI